MKLKIIISILLFSCFGIANAEKVWVSVKYADISQSGMGTSIASVKKDDLGALLNGATSFGFIKLSNLTALAADGKLTKVRDTPMMGKKFWDGDMYIRLDNILSITELHPDFVEGLLALHE